MGRGGGETVTTRLNHLLGGVLSALYVFVSTEMSVNVDCHVFTQMSVNVDC